MRGNGLRNDKIIFTTIIIIIIIIIVVIFIIIVIINFFNTSVDLIITIATTKLIDKRDGKWRMTFENEVLPSRKLRQPKSSEDIKDIKEQKTLISKRGWILRINLLVPYKQKPTPQIQIRSENSGQEKPPSEMFIVKYAHHLWISYWKCVMASKLYQGIEINWNLLLISVSSKITLQQFVWEKSFGKKPYAFYVNFCHLCNVSVISASEGVSSFWALARMWLW